MSTTLRSLLLVRVREMGMAVLFFILTGNLIMAQCTFPNFTPVSTPIPGSTYFKGYLVHLPSDYNTSGTSTTYPLIISFPGNEGAGDGTPTGTGLCKLLSDQPHNLPGRVASGDFPLSGVTVNGVTREFIVVVAQFSGYDYANNNYPKANDVEALLNQITNTYRVDPTRIYLTGISAGANLALQYPASSVTRAQRIAAIAVLSGCTPTNASPNQPGDAAHIATGNVATWFIHCPQDGTGPGSFCDIGTPQGWVNAINSSTPAPTVPASLTTLRPFDNSVPSPRPIDMCQGFTHDTWEAAYTQTYRPAELGNRNVYEWMLSNVRAASALPVTLKSFTARLQSGKVYLRWAVATENKNAFFTLERSGNNQQFSSIATVMGSGTSAHEKVYEYTDSDPISNLSYYRLVQTDDNNKKTYFEVRKIMNRSGLTKLLTANPNPFKNELSAFIHVDRSQRVNIWITDMNGKKLVSTQSMFSEGTTTVNLDIAALPSGIYFLKASGEGITEINKIIKQ